MGQANSIIMDSKARTRGYQRQTSATNSRPARRRERAQRGRTPMRNLRRIFRKRSRSCSAPELAGSDLCIVNLPTVSLLVEPLEAPAASKQAPGVVAKLVAIGSDPNKLRLSRQIGPSSTDGPQSDALNEKSHCVRIGRKMIQTREDTPSKLLRLQLLPPEEAVTTLNFFTVYVVLGAADAATQMRTANKTTIRKIALEAVNETNKEKRLFFSSSTGVFVELDAHELPQDILRKNPELLFDVDSFSESEVRSNVWVLEMFNRDQEHVLAAGDPCPARYGGGQWVEMQPRSHASDYQISILHMNYQET